MFTSNVTYSIMNFITTLTKSLITDYFNCWHSPSGSVVKSTLYGRFGFVLPFGPLTNTEALYSVYGVKFSYLA